VRPQVVDGGNGLHKVTYTPESVGSYVIPVKYGGDEVPASPFHVQVAETGDASKVKFLGLYRRCVLNILYLSIKYQQRAWSRSSAELKSEKWRNVN